MKKLLKTNRAVSFLLLLLAPISATAQTAPAQCDNLTDTPDPLSTEAQDCLGSSSQVMQQILAPGAPLSSPVTPVVKSAPRPLNFNYVQGKEIYSWKQTGGNYVANLNYQGNTATETETTENLATSYNGIYQASTSLFSTMATDMENTLNKAVQANKEVSKYGYRGSHVTLGNEISFKMLGTGTLTDVQINIPQMTASLTFKKEAALGLLEADCTETLTVPPIQITGTLNIITGVLTSNPIAAKGLKGDMKCHDSIPLLGGLIADLADHIADDALQPTINKYSTPGGFPMKADNFGGINKLLGTTNLTYNGTNYGPLIKQDLTNFFQTGEVDFGVYNLTTNTPKVSPNATSPQTTTTQPLVYLNIPSNNISLNVQVQQTFASVGKPKPENSFVEALLDNPLIRIAIGASLKQPANNPNTTASNIANTNAANAYASAVSASALSASTSSRSNASSSVALAIPPSAAQLSNAVSSAISNGSITTNGLLTSQVKSLQQDMINRFESVAPSVADLVHDTTTSNKVVDLSDVEDSAIWTGVYLASQCLRSAASQKTPTSPGDPVELTAANKQIEWALESVERLFDVTGVPGLLARFAYNSNDPNSQNLAFTKTATPANGWTMSTAKAGWNYMGVTSKDQYTGIMFGLGVCNQLSKDPNIQKRTQNRLIATVNMLSKSGWSIPNDTGSSATIGLQTQAAWLKLASIAQPVSSGQTAITNQYTAAMTKLTTNLTTELSTELNPTVINNFEEYYGWNLAYLQTYPMLQFEQNPNNSKYWSNYFTTKMWNETYNQGNTEFTFMKLGSMGLQGSRDQTSFDQALDSLDELSVRNRRDFPVNNSNDPSLGRATVPANISSDLNSKGFGIINSYLNPVQAANPIPVANRVPDTYMWEVSPFQLVGGGSGLKEAPTVDTIFAYWLGRYHHLIGADN